MLSQVLSRALCALGHGARRRGASMRYLQQGRGHQQDQWGQQDQQDPGEDTECVRFWTGGERGELQEGIPLPPHPYTFPSCLPLLTPLDQAP